MKKFLPALLAFAFVAACSSDAPNDPEEDAADTTRRDTENDTDPGSDVTADVETDATPDTAPDVTETDADAGDDAEEDVDPWDTNPIDCEVTFDECDSSAIFCIEGVDGAPDEVGFCSRCGQILRTETCDVLEVCEDPEGRTAPSCRPCEGDECPILNDCEPNGRACLDYNTVEICGPDGVVDTVADCAAGRRCFRGSCGSAGASTGALCTQNINPETGCNGHACLCGTEFTEAEGGAATCAALPGLNGGYCSTLDCRANGCDTAREVCADFGISGQLDGEAYCVTKSECTRWGSPCGDRTNFRCVELPGPTSPDGPIEWGMGCWAPVPTIGEACSSDRDCLGGECRTRDVGGANVSYCTMPCGEDAGCPSHATCVEDPDSSSGYVCLANSGSASCPRIDTEPLRISSTPPLPRFGRGSQSVCYFAR